jgi:cytochrome c peroxidase
MRFTPLTALLAVGAALGVAFAASSLPSYFPPLPVPADNPQGEAKIQLGRQLFYDRRLSADNTISCSDCHQQIFAFSNAGNRVSTGIRGQKGTRNAPSLGNVAWRKSLFWEGGSPSLELQAMGPITAHDEMGMEPAVLVKKLSSIPGYKKQFDAVFKDGVTMLGVTRAIASFERTLVTANSAWDRYRAGDEKALSASALRGMELFFGEQGDCFHCHNGFNFTDEALHNTGVNLKNVDIGLARITGKKTDEGKFKTPTLRNIALTAPYMHDGSIPSLEAVLEHYNSGGKDNDNVDVLMRPLGLSKTDIADLIAFLKSLTDTAFTKNPKLAKPAALP